MNKINLSSEKPAILFWTIFILIFDFMHLALVHLMLSFGYGTLLITNPSNCFSIIPVGVYYCWIQYSALEGTAGADGNIEFSSNLLSYLRLQKTWMIFGKIESAMELC